MGECKMSEFKHAITKDQKSERRQNILDAAKYLFSTTDFKDIKMIDVATMADVSKGSVFLYFKTKEDLFTALLVQEFQAWYRKFQMILSDGQIRDYINTDILIKLLEKSIFDNDILLRLLSISHSVLEQNLSYEQASEYRQVFYECIHSIGNDLDVLISFFKEGDGCRFIQYCITLIIGLYGSANPPELLDMIDIENEYETFRIIFKHEITSILKVILTGMEQSSGK